MALNKRKEEVEFGDYQTPAPLAQSAIQVVKKHLSIVPHTVVEPTCGWGNFLIAAADVFPDADTVIGADVNATYIAQTQQRISSRTDSKRFSLNHADFFQVDWRALLQDARQPLLIVGNPPWVTNAALGAVSSGNLPEKTNFQGHRGLDAITGKANFDISEWMLIQNLHWLDHRTGAMAVLCKVSVARKVLLYAWKQSLGLCKAKIFKIDAGQHFGAAVDACLLVVESEAKKAEKVCDVYSDLEDKEPETSFGYDDTMLVADLKLFHQYRHFLGGDENYTWRSGVKHDCTKVMEIEKTDDGYRNKLGLTFELESNYVYPLFKSSDIAHSRLGVPRKYVLVPQKRVGEDTAAIELTAPNTWAYLNDNAALLDRRGSSIYKKKPRFSIFGIGDYAFADWKVAISGFYKKLDFKCIGPVEGRPAMLDDTAYFLSCRSEAEARFLADLLNSDGAKSFFESMVFWGDKRPITVELLKRLNIAALAENLGLGAEYQRYVQARHLEDQST